jgi:hypothetical protein
VVLPGKLTNNVPDAKRAKVDRRTHYNWLKEDPWYVQAFRQAVQEAGDALEDKLNELAHEGNVTAAIFLLKGLRPNKYRERSQVDVKYPKTIDELPEELLDDFINQFAQLAEAHKELDQRKHLEAGPVVDIRATDSSTTG